MKSVTCNIHTECWSVWLLNPERKQISLISNASARDAIVNRKSWKTIISPQTENVWIETIGKSEIISDVMHAPRQVHGLAVWLHQHYSYLIHAPAIWTKKIFAHFDCMRKVITYFHIAAAQRRIRARLASDEQTLVQRCHSILIQT